MKAFIQRFVAPHAKFIAAAVGVAGVILSPEDVDLIVAVLTALGVYAVRNTAVA